MTAIAEVPFTAVQPFANRADGEHCVDVEHQVDAMGFAALAEGRIIGVAGLPKFATGQRIKGVWVAPERRGKGVGDALATRLIEVAEA